jgi:ribonuclease BN (tRNA processing enzyme)
LIEGFGSRILLDCGSGVLARLAGLCRHFELDAVILSHLHFDHCSDMLVLRYALDEAARLGRLPQPVPVWCPATPADVAELMTYKEALRASPIRSDQPVTIAGLTAEFLPVKHPIESYGVILRPAKAPAVGALFFYTGDTEWVENLPKAIGDCEILLVESTLTGAQGCPAPGAGHLTIGEAVRLGGMTNAKTIILTHYPPDRPEEEIVLEARRHLARPIVVATEGLEITWP